MEAKVRSSVTGGKRPSIKVLGVYRLKVTERLIQDALNLIGGDQREAAMGLLEGAVLIEVQVEHATRRFKVGDFNQPIEGRSQEWWQVAYDEAYLSPDGRAVVSKWKPPEGVRTYRIAFWLHDFQPGVPLGTSYGPVALPPAGKLPVRLQRLLKYVPPD